LLHALGDGPVVDEQDGVEPKWVFEVGGLVLEESVRTAKLDQPLFLHVLADGFDAQVLNQLIRIEFFALLRFLNKNDFVLTQHVRQEVLLLPVSGVREIFDRNILKHVAVQGVSVSDRNCEPDFKQVGTNSLS